MIIGGLGSVIMGTALPISNYIGGKMMDSYISPSNILGQARDNMFDLIYLGIGSVFVGMVMNISWNITA